MGIIADRRAANRLLGRVDDPLAHGNHAITDYGRVYCGYRSSGGLNVRSYKNGFAPCQINAACDHNYAVCVYDGARYSYVCRACDKVVGINPKTGRFEGVEV